MKGPGFSEGVGIAPTISSLRLMTRGGNSPGSEVGRSDGGNPSIHREEVVVAWGGSYAGSVWLVSPIGHWSWYYHKHGHLWFSPFQLTRHREHAGAG